jgi:hypothetical protein
MQGFVTPLARSEIIVGATSALMLLVGKLLAQLPPVDPAVGPATPWMAILTQCGGIGLAVWLVILHTTKTIPKMQDDHRAERAEMVKAFQDRCDRQEKCFSDSLDKIIAGSRKP